MDRSAKVFGAAGRSSAFTSRIVRPGEACFGWLICVSESTPVTHSSTSSTVVEVQGPSFALFNSATLFFVFTSTLRTGLVCSLTSVALVSSQLMCTQPLHGVLLTHTHCEGRPPGLGLCLVYVNPPEIARRPPR